MFSALGTFGDQMIDAGRDREVSAAYREAG
jgi:hypothetical protein